MSAIRGEWIFLDFLSRAKDFRTNTFLGVMEIPGFAIAADVELLRKEAHNYRRGPNRIWSFLKFSIFSLKSMFKIFSIKSRFNIVSFSAKSKKSISSIQQFNNRCVLFIFTKPHIIAALFPILFLVSLLAPASSKVFSQDVHFYFLHFHFSKSFFKIHQTVKFQPSNVWALCELYWTFTK